MVGKISRNRTMMKRASGLGPPGVRRGVFRGSAGALGAGAVIVIFTYRA